MTKWLRSDAASGFPLVAHKQIGAWRDQLDLLRGMVRNLLMQHPQIASAHLVLEYRIPRREKRIDAVLLLGGTVVIIEFKVGSSSQSAEAVEQVSTTPSTLPITMQSPAADGLRRFCVLPEWTWSSTGRPALSRGLSHLLCAAPMGSPQ